MKRILLVIVAGLTLYACTSGKKSTTAQPGITEVNVDLRNGLDSSNYSNDSYIVTRVVDKKELQCQWNVLAMHRAEYIPADSLQGVFLKFLDKEFSGMAPCGSVKASYELNGNNITIWNVKDVKQNCGKPRQETAYLDLLASKVKNLRIEGNKLILMDESHNTVFHCVRAAAN